MKKNAKRSTTSESGRADDIGSYFISYNQKDRHWAEWVAWVIEELGHTVAIQAWDVLPGNTWTHEIEQRLATARSLVLILSPHSIDAPFVGAEWHSAFAGDPTGSKRSLIPVRVGDCDLPALLKTRVYIDLVGTDRESAKELVRSAVIGKRLKPNREPNFPNNSTTEPAYPGECPQRVLFAMVLDGQFDENDLPRVEAVANHLRRLLRDSSLTIVSAHSGSVILVVEASFEAYDALLKLLQDDPDVKLLGDRILAQWRLNAASGDPLEQRLRDYRNMVTGIFSKAVDSDTAEDLAQEFMLAVLSSGRDRYSILQSPARAASLAEGLLIKHQQEVAEEARARSVIGKEVVRDLEHDRTAILRLSMQIFENLDEDAKELMEHYWSARFEGHDLLDDLVRGSELLNETYRKRLRLQLPDNLDD